MSQISSLSISSDVPSTSPRPVSSRSPGWRVVGYLCTLLGVVCLMGAAHGLGDDEATRSRAVGGWVAVGGSGFFLATGFRLLRQRTLHEP